MENAVNLDLVKLDEGQYVCHPCGTQLVQVTRQKRNPIRNIVELLCPNGECERGRAEVAAEANSNAEMADLLIEWARTHAPRNSIASM